MFWKKCKKKYATATADDPDIKAYFDVMKSIQSSGYDGVLGFIQDMGHKYISRCTTKGKTLEIGFGRGRQSLFFKGDPNKYYPIEINPSYFVSETWNQFVNAAIADAKSLPYEDCYFDQVVSIYNLEHISDLEAVLNEIKRVLKASGKFIVALPCEDGFAWNFGRELTTRRIYSHKYGINYDKIIAYEHKHCLVDVINLLDKFFVRSHSRYYPFILPMKDINLIFCATYTLR